jgi:ABC transport system ATP-binding/permease protein
VGHNGSGKSTLLDVLAGRRSPVQGRVVHGSTVRIGYYDQRGAQLPLDQRVREVVAGPTRQPDWTDAALLERFWFADDTQWAPVGLLSGGERRRLQLVLVLRQAPNVLLLDEPTNDLDLDTLRALEDTLETWPGALVVVSHDRAFLERTVEDVIVLDGQGHAGRIPGGYAAYEAERRALRGRRGSVTTSVSERRPTTSAGAGSSSSLASSPSSPRPPKQRSASTLRRMLQQADKATAKLRDRQESLEAELAGAGDDRVALARVGEELAELQGALEAAEEQWLALAEEAEEAGVSF